MKRPNLDDYSELEILESGRTGWDRFDLETIADEPLFDSTDTAKTYGGGRDTHRRRIPTRDYSE